MPSIDNGSPVPCSWRCGDFLVEPECNRLLRDGVPVDIEQRAFDLIVLLATHHERAVDRREITAALWGPRPVSENTLRQVVYKARRALGDDGQRQSMIRTLHGRSLRWVAPIERLAEPAVAAWIDSDAATSGFFAPPVRRRMAALAAALLLATVAGALLFMRAPSASARPRVAIVPIENATGEAALDWTRNGLPGLLSSLLEGSGIDVVEPHAVAQAWNYRSVAGTTREQRLREATGADVVVGGRMRKLAGALYELDLSVQPARRGDAEIRITGERPGTLAADAVTRLRHALGVDDAVASRRNVPANAFVAEAYAHGTDAVARGRMDEARSYFEVCARDAPAFLPCSYGLGATEVATRQLDDGEATLDRVLTAAGQQGDAHLTAKALDELAYVSIMRHRFAEARERLLRADPAVARSGDVDIGVTHALRVADVEGRLKRVDAAAAALAHARDLIARHGLRRRQADLHNAESILAGARGDAVAQERAQRAALAASEALGNERDAAGDAYNLALSLMQRDRRDEAMPLLARAYANARGKDAWLSFGAGDNLAIALLDGGLDARAAAIATQLAQLAQSQDNKSWQALTRLLDGAIALFRSDPSRARDAFAAASDLLDAAQDPQLSADTLLFLATAAYSVAPPGVATVAKRFDALAASQPKAAWLDYPRHLIDALDDAAAGHADAARAQLEAAAAMAHAQDTADGNLRMVAFTLGQREPSAAASVVAGFDARSCEDATILHLYAAWAVANGDAAAARRASTRIAELRAGTSAAMANAAPLIASDDRRTAGVHGG